MLKVHDIYIYIGSVTRRCSNIFTVDVTYLLIKGYSESVILFVDVFGCPIH